MNETRMLAYVETAAALLKLPLDAARTQRVALNLQRTAVLADLLENAPLAPHDEPAEIFRPAAFLPFDSKAS